MVASARQGSPASLIDWMLALYLWRMMGLTFRAVGWHRWGMMSVVTAQPVMLAGSDFAIFDDMMLDGRLVTFMIGFYVWARSGLTLRRTMLVRLRH